MAEIVRPCVCSLVGQRIADGMTQHMRMRLERQFGLNASPFKAWQKPAVENGELRSDTNTKDDLASRFNARNALSSSPSS
jgi:hypothetical protein